MCGAPGSQATVPAGDQSQTSCLCHHSKATHSMSISKHFLAARSGIKVILWGTAGTESLGEKLRGAALCSYAAVFMSDLQELFSRRQEEPGSGRFRVNMARSNPCSTDSHWELPSCSSPELSRGKFKSWAEFASVRSSVLLQPSVFKGV